MNFKLQHAELHLEPSQIIRLLDVAGAHVRVLRGLLWITQHKDGRDQIVPAGKGITLDRSGLTLIHALEPTEVGLSDPVPAPKRRRHFLGLLATVFCQSGNSIPGKKDTDMEDLTYESYLADPRVREQLEREARRARAEAMYEYVVAPLARLFTRMFRRLPVSFLAHSKPI